MTRDALSTVSTRATSQREAATPEQVQNSAGGFTFEITDRVRLNRFLVLGSDGATYYASPRDLTKDNAEVVLRMAVSDGITLVNDIVSVSEAGRAPKANPALFALAIAASHGNDETRKAALDALPRVARIGTHLFIFTRYVEQFRGWGRGLRRAVAKWYERDTDDVTFQVLKYRQREGWSHRDLLRLSHPNATGGYPKEVLFEWICGRPTDGSRPYMLDGFIKAQEVGADIPALIREYGLTWEMLPDEALGKVGTWDALLDKGMPQTALMRQLPRLTNLGMLPASGGRTAEVAAQLQDAAKLKRARVHPINVLIAQRTYASGQSARGSGEWKPSRKIVDALDAGFYAAFGAVEPTGKRTLLALDVSGSMSFSNISNMPITPREASAALALVTANVEKDYAIVGFTSSNGRASRMNTGLSELDISPRQRLDDVIRTVSNLNFGGTDCALPWVVAKQEGWKIDTCVTYTDNETWAGRIHPHQALTAYRRASGIPARAVVCGMTSTGFSVADPKDAGSMDIAGFDSAVPGLISDFARG